MKQILRKLRPGRALEKMPLNTSHLLPQKCTVGDPHSLPNGIIGKNEVINTS